MVSKAKTISYGTAKLEYDANKTIGREHVASEACRHNLYGETPSEIAREMRDIQERSHPNLTKCYFDIVITLSESDSEKVQTQEECQKLVEEYMQRLMVQQLGLSQEQFPCLVRVPEPFHHLHSHGIHGGISLPLRDWRGKDGRGIRNRICLPALTIFFLLGRSTKSVLHCALPSKGSALRAFGQFTRL